MGKKPLARSSLCVLLGIFFLFLVSLGYGAVKAERVTDYPDARVNRIVQIENGGAIVINDAVTLSCDAGKNVRSLDSFQIGFPSGYRNDLAYYSAYDAAGKLQTGVNTSVNGAEFAWMNVSFSRTIDVSDGGNYKFTAVYVLSGLMKENQTLFYADFPAYPSLAMRAVFCNITVMLPDGAKLNSTSPIFSNETIDSRLVLYSLKTPLEAYSNASSWVKFTASNFMLLEVDEWEREIKIDGLGGLTVTDSYQITNKANEALSKLSLVLPPNASDVSAQDVYGTLGGVTVSDRGNYVEAGVTFRTALTTNQKVKLLIVYGLPFSKYVSQKGWQDYTLNVSLARPDNWVLRQSIVTIVLPEGAEFQTSSKTSYHLENEGFLVEVKFAEDNVTKFYEASIDIGYRYLILWASFRPTLWVGAVAVILGGVFFVRKTSKPEAAVTIPLSSEVLRRFVDTYEEKRRLKLELESLEQQVQKGKISRRRHKLQKSSLDGRLSKIQKDLTELRREIEVAGGQYSERMRQLETAETEIETLERDSERVEIRFRCKEISAEARRRLLDEYNRIKERAENTIAEILLRLREEIR